MDAGEPIVCPTCARAYAPSERFCEACGMPLVHPTRRRARGQRAPATARKIKPQYAEGALVKVARAKNQPEAEFIAGLLLEEGIPCLLRNSIGGYSPMIGPREILVPESGARGRARSARVRAAQSGEPDASLLDEDGLAGASLVIARISSEARSNSASESTGVPSNGSSRWSSTQALGPVYSSLTLTVTGRGMR